MEFCGECGSILKPTKIRSGNQTLLMLACSKCGRKKQETNAKLFSAKVFEHNPKQLVAVIGREEQELNPMPTIHVECPRCGNNTANIWQVQTRGSDAPSTQFLRCIRCGYTYRETT